MVQAFVTISEHANRILNIIKAKYGLKNKSEAIEIMASQYEKEILEPELRPSYIEKANMIQEQDPIQVGSVAELRKRYK